MKNLKHTKKGQLTAYALACGEIEKYSVRSIHGGDSVDIFLSKPCQGKGYKITWIKRDAYGFVKSEEQYRSTLHYARRLFNRWKRYQKQGRLF